MGLRFRTRADFARGSSRTLIDRFAEMSAKNPQVRSACFDKAERVQAAARSTLLSAPVTSTSMERNAQMTAALVNVEATRTFPRRSVAPGSPIPVALASSLSRDTAAWENGDKGRPATFFFTRAVKAVGG